MKKVFLSISLFLSTLAVQAVPTITIDGDKSDWAEVPMLSQPGTWPMLKVLPAADAEMGTNALAFMLENAVDFDPSWGTYTTEYIDKDYDVLTREDASVGEGGYNWQYPNMGVDYKCTYGVNSSGWISFPKAMSANNKYFEIGIPASWLTDLGTKFGFALYYGSGSWYCPDYSATAHKEIKDQKGFLYKTRSITSLPGTVTASNAFAHPTMGECTSYVDFGMRDNGNDTARWAAFPIRLVEPARYDVTANVSSTNGWKFEFWLVDMATNAIVAHLAPPESNVSSSKSSHTFGTLDLTSIEPGCYMLKVKNRTPNSTVKLNTIDLTYAGGTKVVLPSTVSVNDAWFSPNGTRADGVITYSSIGSGCWAKWNVSVPNTGIYDITINIKNEYGHNFLVEFFEAGNATPVASISEGGTNYGHDLTLYPVSLGKVNLAEGNYEMKVSNSIGDARFVSVKVAYAGGAVVNVPGTLNCADAVLERTKMIRDDDGIIHYKDNGTPGNEYAWWKINVTQTGTYTVSALVELDPERVAAGRSASDHQFSIALHSSLESSAIATSAEASVNNNTGVRSLPNMTFEGTGVYYIRLDNLKANSSALLSKVVIAPALSLSEEHTPATTPLDDNDGKVVNAQLTRSFVAGMYNTICLPFAVSAAELNRVFPDADLKQLESSSIEEGDFVLNLNFEEAATIEAGKPYLIKPAADQTNPKFLGVTIDKTLRPTNTSRANFIGNFVSGNIPAGEDNLFLGANDLLYFSPTQDMPILGMRAYFNVHGVAASAIHRARIVEQNNVVTEIDLVQPDAADNVPATTVSKRIVNGQLLIIRDGVEYNVFGQITK